MSYRCERCKKAVPNGVQAHKVVVETRPKRYEYPDRPPGVGREIVREITVCRECLRELPQG